MGGGVHFDAAIVRRYDVPGPRYTSYPTALQFSETIGEADYLKATRASNDDPIPRPLSIYVHVPFCTSPCFYCGCTRVITRDRTAGARYLSRLQREIELQARLFDRDRTVDQLHFGGGTPTFLSDAELAELMRLMRHSFSLRDDRLREFSIEVDPRTVDDARLAAIAAEGFNRISLGVQDFDPEVQKAVNRIQPREDVLAVMTAARRHGFQSISVDLIYGLPKQTEDGFAHTLDQVIAARPDRVAAYSYAHLPKTFKGQTQIKSEDLCPPEVKLALLGITIDKLTAAGYIYIGMDHFALPDDELSIALADGSLQRNFQGYSTRAGLDLVGLGMSAIGQVCDLYIQNERLLDDWAAALDRGRLPIWRGYRLTPEDRIRRAAIRALMCRGELDLHKFGERYNVDFSSHFAAELAKLEPLEKDGLLEVGAGRLTVTPLGRLLVRAIAMQFDAYLNQDSDGGKRRFSRIV
ncbi:MAG: oxygen-independent coproporphyrinogen III oxidase [Gammaproteobacteria bacterium]|nr:oxygen-independent coproporphyrinogen III oxidase [Gammaproteobacteria bacterium]